MHHSSLVPGKPLSRTNSLGRLCIQQTVHLSEEDPNIRFELRTRESLRICTCTRIKRLLVQGSDCSSCKYSLTPLSTCFVLGAGDTRIRAHGAAGKAVVLGEATFSKKTAHGLPVGILLAKLNCSEKLPC